MAITFNSVPTTAAASAVFVEQEAVSRISGSPVIPHKILLVGQYNSGSSPTVNVPQLILNEADAWTRYGRGSLLARQYKAAFDAVRGAVPIYALPLADDGSGVAATGTIVVGVTTAEAGTLAVYVGGTRIPVAVTAAESADDIGAAIAAAVNAKLDLPVTAANVTGTVTFTVRWAGATGNQITLETNMLDTDETPGGVTATVTDIGAVVAGANDPDATTALAALDDTWFTTIAWPYQGDTELDVLEAAYVVREAYDVNRPFAAFVGYADTNANLLTALASRNSEATTYVPVHGSSTPDFFIGAAAAGIWAGVQQATPGRPAKNRLLPGVLAGTTNLTYSEQDTTVKVGGSTTRNTSSGSVVIVDLVTTRTTTDAGADETYWRFTHIIGADQFKRYALEQTFLASPFDQGVVLSDSDVGGPTYGIRPNTVKAFAIGLVDDWISRGLSKNRDTIVSGITAEINSSNPGRIDLLIPDISTAGLRILATKLESAFA